MLHLDDGVVSSLDSSAPVALLSLYTRTDLLEEVAEPAYQELLRHESLAAVEAAGGRRIYGGAFDLGSEIADDLTLDEFPDGSSAERFARKLYASGASGALGGLTVLAFEPIYLPFGIRFSTICRPMSWLLSAFWPLKDDPVPAGRSFPEGMVGAPPAADVARRSQEFDLDSKKGPAMANDGHRNGKPMGQIVMLNLNKMRRVAKYPPSSMRAQSGSAPGSGIAAYRRYSNPLSLMRRGAFPVYMARYGRCVIRNAIEGDNDDEVHDMTASAATERSSYVEGPWSQLILVTYPSWQTAFRMIMAPGYAKRSRHRDAALKRAIVRPTTPWISRWIDDEFGHRLRARL